MRPALELRDLLDQVRELVRVEVSLLRAEIGERTSGSSSLMAVVVEGVFCFAFPSGWFWLQPVLPLLRLGLPLDLSFLIVAVVAIVISLILVRSGVGARQAITPCAGKEHLANLIIVGRSLAWRRSWRHPVSTRRKPIVPYVASADRGEGRRSAI